MTLIMDCFAHNSSDVKHVKNLPYEIFMQMSSEGPNHDELDFEFLGNISGEPYLVQTNVYVNGSGNREQRQLFGLILQQTSIPILSFGIIGPSCKLLNSSVPRINMFLFS